MDHLTSCDTVWDLLSLYADGEANAGERLVVERHVDSCESCALDLQFLRETSTVLAQTPLVAPPPDLKQAILAATIYRPSWQERLREAAARALPAPRLRMAGAAMAMLLVGVVFYRGAQLPLPIGEPVTVRQHKSTGIARPGLTQKHPAAAGNAGRERSANPVQPSSTLLASAAPTLPAARRSVSNPPVITSSPVRVASTSPRVGAVVSRVVLKAPTVTARAPARRTLNSRPQDDSRLAVAPAPKPVDESPLSEPGDMRDPTGVMGGAKVAGNNPARDAKSDPASADAASSAPRTRYTLTASMPSAGADALGTFAELRSALRKRSDSARTVAMDLGLHERNAMVDVYRSRF